MAFHSMMTGADCGPSNPLQNLLKHSDRDPSAQYDRFHPSDARRAGPSSMRSYVQVPIDPAATNDAERFFNQGPMAGSAFHMDSLRKELDSASSSTRGTPSLEAAWSSANSGPRSQAFPKVDFVSPGLASPNQRPGMLSHASQDASNWRQQFAASHAEPEAGLYGNAPPMGMGFAPHSMPAFGGMGGMGGQMFFGSGNVGLYENVPAAAEGKGKGRLVELTDANWEAEFAKVGEESKDKEDVTTLQSESAQEKDKSQDTSGSQSDEMRSLENDWNNIKDSLNQSSLADSELAAWEAKYGSRFADPDYDYDEDIVKSETDFTPESVGDFLNGSITYPFQPNNPFMEHTDPLAEAHKLLREGAPLTQAALAIEASCAKNGDAAEAWRLLGETHAADEKENLAIKAFEKAVACGGPSGEAGWLALAVSWVNEGQEIRALATLERWLQGSYPGVISQMPPRVEDHTNPWERHSRVVDMFLAAARAGPSARQGEGVASVAGSPVDADVQMGLGVLFYTNSEYDRARDCFEAALNLRPDDFLLWNRLGATLANGGSPETAIDAYRKALELRPTFTRAIYNLGVSCLNINCFQEAAEHLLAALSLHRKSGEVVEQLRQQPHPLLPEGDGSDNLWHTLRRAFLCMDRHDLAERAKPGADVESFRKDGFEF